MSTPPIPQPSNSGGFTGILASIGSALIPSNLQTELTTVETEIEQGLAVMVGLEFIIALELLLLVAMTWKERHG
jgi:hypothetical protein